MQRYGHCDYSFSLFFNSLLLERPFFPLASRFYTGLGFIHSPQPRVSFIQPEAARFNLTQVRLNNVMRFGILQPTGGYHETLGRSV